MYAIVQDYLGNFIQRMPVTRAREVAAKPGSRLYLFRRGNGAAFRTIYRERHPEFAQASNSEPNPTALTKADLRALMHLEDRRRIAQPRWERLHGYGLNPNPALMAEAR